MKKTLNIILLFFIALSLSGQEVKFRSALFEAGVKHHVGATSTLSVAQLDTITQLNLSGLGLTDISDVELLPNLKVLDLSTNLIRDVKPLCALDSLRNVNLSNNVLESINMLSFSHAREMFVDVAFNFIKDFSCFNTLTYCDFTIDGAGLQREKNSPYFNVLQFYADIDEKDKAVVSYRGQTNMDKAISLDYGNTRVTAVLDGNFKTVTIPLSAREQTKVFLTNGEKCDSTWVIPTSAYEIKPNVTINLELPEEYTLGYVGALHGTVSVDGTSLTYTATETVKSDVIEYSYYEGARLRGFSRCYLVEDPTEVCSINVDDEMDVDIIGKKLFIKCPTLNSLDFVTATIYNASGKMMRTQQSTIEVDHTIQIPVSNLASGVYIVTLSNGKSKKFVIK